MVICILTHGSGHRTTVTCLQTTAEETQEEGKSPTQMLFSMPAALHSDFTKFIAGSLFFLFVFETGSH